MKIGLIDVDSHNFPNLAQMKLSAWHKSQGDTYTPDPLEPVNCDELIKGGTGWPESKDLPPEIEHIYPDYGLYGITDTAYGFLTRGCPRGCAFCLVSGKEGRKSVKVADLSEWWRGQRKIELLDPNILACRDHMDLLRQLSESGAEVNFNAGVDCRLLHEESAAVIAGMRKREVHFAWDHMKDEASVLRGLKLYARQGKKGYSGRYATVYTLVNFGTTLEEDLYRIRTLWDMGYYPYVMIYDKPHAPRILRDLQRWCNNRFIFKSCPDFRDYRKTREEDLTQQSLFRPLSNNSSLQKTHEML